MRILVCAMVLSLAVFTGARKQLMCKATPDSVLYFLAKDEEHPISCTSSSSDFEVTEKQYDGVIMRLEKAEMELSSTKAALSKLTEKVEDFLTVTIEPTPTEQTTTRSTTEMTTPKLSPKFLEIMRTWTKSGNMYYKYFRNDNVNYLTAKKRCESHGARLASTVIRDPNVISDLEQAGFVNSKIFDSWLWIGFNDRVTEGDWIWSDGGSMNTQTTGWWPGEPNQFKDTNEDCGCILAVEKGKVLLNDAPCSFTLQYICEAELSSDVVG